MAQVELGATSEVWFAPHGDKSDKNSFLIRDDAYGKGSAQFGRTLRLGDPIDTGPSSVWRQTSWAGGNDQDQWSDEEMFDKGTLDSTTDRGKLKFWPGWWRFQGEKSEAITRYTFEGGVTGFGVDTPSFYGECNTFGREGAGGATTPPGGYTFFRREGTGSVTALYQFSASVNAICRMDEDNGPGVAHFMCIGLADGKFFVYDTAFGNFILESEGAGIEIDTMLGYNNHVFYNRGNQLWKRAQGGVHTLVTTISDTYTIRGMAVWNNRLWFTTISGGGVCDLYMTDGVNVTHAHKFVGEFIPWNLVVHYGSLYLVGGRDGAVAGSGSVGLVWRYSGTTLTLLYEEGTGRDGEDHTIYGCTSFMRWLVWSRNGTTSTGRLPGLTYYDAELDSIHTGPTMPMDPASPGVTVWTVKNYSNTIVASFWDQHTYSATVVGPVALAQVRELGEVKHGNFGGYEGASFEYVSGGQERANALNSSEYDAGLPGERKVWLTGRLRAKIPALTRVYVNMTFDGTEYTVAEIAGGDGTWQTYTFDVLVDGVNPRSYVAKYTLQFNNTHNSINTLSTPEVDSFEVTYMVSPAPRRRWNLRVLASDGQMRLDGNENPLVTGEELVEQLESYWSDGVPLHYWDRSASGDTPADADSIKVMITNWSAQEYRLTTEDGSSMREVAMELLEIA